MGGYFLALKSYGAETLTLVTANPDNDLGDPKEIATRYNTDPSWYREIEAFADAIINGKKISNGTSNDALETMKLVYKIYHSDPIWREKYNIKDPELYLTPNKII